jgi:hypothetical protein
LIASQTVLAQNQFSTPFVTGMIGASKLSQGGNEQQGQTSFAFGGSFGIPLLKNLFLYTRTAYTSKSNFQSYYNTSYLIPQFPYSAQFVEVNSSFSQLILNGGLLYNIVLSDEFVAGINGGVTFMVVNQEARLLNGTVISSVDNENIWGAFGGLILEKRWGDENFSTIVEAQYNYAESDAFYHSQALSAMNFTFGVRYYIEGR